MDSQKLQAWWAHRQGLDGSLEGASPKDVLERSGWSRSVGGAGPYLTLFSRGGVSRADADAAVAKLQIHELPSARGCTYVVPATDFALALRAGGGFRDGDMKIAIKLGVTEKEIERLCDAILRALSAGPLDPEGIRAATGDASRSLGEAGKNKGLNSTLTVALGQMQVRGDIRRVPVNGRLDQQRYRYALWKPHPLSRDKTPAGQTFTELAKRFFRWHGPATVGEFQWFAGLGVKAAKDATAPLDLVPVEEGSDRLLLRADHGAWKKFKAPSKAKYALVSSLDPISANRRDVKSLLDARDYERHIMADKRPASVASLIDLPSHAILDRGRIVGFWEFDAEAQRIVWGTFGVKDKALNAEVERTEAFVRDDLGDARSFSLDSPKSRAPRLQAIAAIAGG